MHDPLRQPAFLPDHLTHPGQLGPEGLVGDDDLVEAVGHLPRHTVPVEGHSGREVTRPDLGQDTQQDLGIERVGDGHR
jgi:hypothetical protein